MNEKTKTIAIMVAILRASTTRTVEAAVREATEIMNAVIAEQDEKGNATAA